MTTWTAAVVVRSSMRRRRPGVVKQRREPAKRVQLGSARLQEVLADEPARPRCSVRHFGFNGQRPCGGAKRRQARRRAAGVQQASNGARAPSFIGT
jgi:hypothetical protein